MQPESNTSNFDQQAQLSQVFFDALPQAAVLIDKQHKVCMANSIARSWGVHVGQLLLRPVHPFACAGDDDLIAWRRHLDAALAMVSTDQQSVVQEHVFRGDRLRYTWNPCTENSFMLLVEQLSRQEHRDQASLQTHMQAHTLESLRTFAAGMAHEFNNTLGIISGSMELLRQHKQNHADNIIQPVSQAVERGHSLTESILTFASQNDSSFDNIDIVKVVRSSYNIIKNSVPNDINVVFDCNAESALIRGNAAHIHQVLLHLTSNAIYAIQNSDNTQRGTLHIGLQVEDKTLNQKIRLWVQDNGCGIDPVRRDCIFDPFYTSKPSGQGRGMGLAIVSGIIKKHQGVIDVFSNLNQGTCVDIYLPALSSQTNNSTKGHCCLLVDDDELVRDMTARSLESSGCVCYTADSMDSAIKILNLGIYNFDAVITDWNMPKGNGTELAQYIRANHPELPIVLVSGFVSDHTRQELLDYFDAMLDKPCSAKHIINCLDYLSVTDDTRTFSHESSRP